MFPIIPIIVAGGMALGLWGCSSSNEEEKVESKPAPQASADTPVTLNRTDLNAALAGISAGLNECSVRDLSVRVELGNNVPERNTRLWMAVSSYIVETKYLGAFQQAGTPSSPTNVFFNYDVAKMTGIDAQIRDALAALAPNQRTAAALMIAAHLNENNDDQYPIFSNYSAAQKASYGDLCNSEEPGGLRFWSMNFGTINYPAGITIKGLTKEFILTKITEAAKLPATGGTAAGPYVSVCNFSPNTGIAGNKYAIQFTGSMVGVMDSAATAYLPNFNIDFGQGVTATTPYPVPTAASGVVSQWQVEANIAASATPGRRDITFKLGDQVLATVPGFTVGAARVANTEPQQPAEPAEPRVRRARRGVCDPFVAEGAERDRCNTQCTPIRNEQERADCIATYQ
jgi:hypothetical protein